MKLRMSIGLLLVGSLFVGTGVQARDLTREYLDAIETANEAVVVARDAEERQAAKANVQEWEARLDSVAAEAVAAEGVNPQLFIPGVGTVRVVSVECNGSCSDSTLGQLCTLGGGSGFLPFAVDCQDVEDDNPGVLCGGNNRCLAREVRTTDPLSNYCNDTNGWDAQVYCVRP